MKPENFSAELKDFEVYLRGILKAKVRPAHPKLESFWQGLEYSLFGGGKRFRPLLSLLSAKALGKNPQLVFPLAAAIEMIHTYSLIHDDLPCLDNDDERRGRATHHKVYGEDMALLAGDGLQTLAFFELASSYAHHPNGMRIIEEVSKAAGLQGMVGGQVLDMLADLQAPGPDELKRIHELKTGALIQVSVVGSGLVCEVSDPELKSLRHFGEDLGLAFQIADDIQDAREGETAKNYVGFFGEEKAKALLSEASNRAKRSLDSMKHNTSELRSLIEYNLKRV